MPKTEKALSIGDLRLAVLPDQTRTAYRALFPYTGRDVGIRMFHYMVKNLPADAAAFLEELGIDASKIVFARPISDVQEDGTVLFLAKARLCGRILSQKTENGRRKSEEIAGMSVVFVSRREEFCPDYPPFGEPEIELRFVIPLPFQREFFDQI